jgi:hypothetical protein
VQDHYTEVRTEHDAKQAELKELEKEVKCNEGPKKKLEAAVKEIAKQVFSYACDLKVRAFLGINLFLPGLRNVASPPFLETLPRLKG